jgi:hypothetical protein
MKNEGSIGMGLIRKLDLMHKIYGIRNHKCGECCNFVSWRHHDRILRKCSVYGLTHSEASDWAKSWVACGHFDKEFDEDTHISVINLVRMANKEPETVVAEGQTSLFAEQEGNG